MSPDQSGSEAHVLAVVAAVLVNADGQVLIAQRSANGSEPHLWEFPGGKIGVGESAAQALVRELQEELALGAVTLESLAVVRWRGQPRKLDLHTYKCLHWCGEPVALEHQALKWVAPSQLLQYAMPAPDRPIRARLALPQSYLITPEPSAPRSEFLAHFEVSIANPDIGIASLRAKWLPKTELAKLAERLLERARQLRPDLIVLIHGQPELAMQLGFDGVHLSSQQLREYSRRPLPETKWIFASCHDQIELSLAEHLGADAVTYSPVLHTVSHPQSTPRGWMNLKATVESTCLPCYALGGIGLADMPAVLSAGAHGMAAIRAFWQ